MRVLREEVRPFALGEVAVNCHHNYTARERHFGEDVLVTRKGAVRAGRGELGIIPGSMGARSLHRARPGKRGQLRKLQPRRRTHHVPYGGAEALYAGGPHCAATEGVECRKDAAVIDETPAAYKDIDAVMEAQRDLVEIVYTLKQVVCVKG